MKGKNIVVSRLNSRPTDSQEIEFVERKGLGHPDYIADAIAEAASVELSKEYLSRFGIIMHHNLDKVLIVGGDSRPRFNGGEVLKPIYVLIAGRATTEVRTEGGIQRIPVGPILLRAAKRWIRENFRYLNPEEHLIVDYKIGNGSQDLVDIFTRASKYPGANDTSIGVGYAPLTPTERLVLETEKMLNSREFKLRHPEVGEDVKVMAVRHGRRVDLTIAVAMISSHISDIEEYLEAKSKVKEEILKLASRVTDYDVKVYVNTGDRDKPREEKDIYLVVTGTSAEHGDDGATGRGNRVNGLITPLRPMSMEAAAGKNPVNHVGKLYNLIAFRVAKKVSQIDEVKEVYVKILSQIGRPINDPLIAHAALVLNDNERFNAVKNEVEVIFKEELDKIMDLKEDILRGSINLF